VVFRPNLTRSERWHLIDTVKGVTTAATIFAAAAIGAACGFGRLIMAVGGTALVLLALEIRHIPVLKLADGRRYASRFANDDEEPSEAAGRRRGKDAAGPDEAEGT
jgi:putative Mg2+ transporter-C (MgtC) family protein